MFCQDCGAELTQNARFCASCGASVAPSEAPVHSAPRSLQEKTFWDEDGILVTDAVFRVANGDSFPVRNISSVTVKEKPPNTLLVLLAAAFILFGLFICVGSVTVGVIFILIGGAFWAMLTNPPHQLKIGAGGVTQVAIEGKSAEQLQNIAKAINEALIYIQRAA